MPRHLSSERDQFRRANRVLGHYLATCCWLGRVDGVVLDRQDLERFFFTTLHDDRRVKWLVEDVEIWFPVNTKLVYTTEKPASIYLSRVKWTEFPEGKMSDAQRIALLKESECQLALYREISLEDSDDHRNVVERISRKMLLISAGDMTPFQRLHIDSVDEKEN